MIDWSVAWSNWIRLKKYWPNFKRIKSIKNKINPSTSLISHYHMITVCFYLSKHLKNLVLGLGLTRAFIQKKNLKLICAIYTEVCFHKNYYLTCLYIRKFVWYLIFLIFVRFELTTFTITTVSLTIYGHYAGHHIQNISFLVRIFIAFLL
jgi:hypothetical protein